VELVVQAVVTFLAQQEAQTLATAAVGRKVQAWAAMAVQA
jgi:hypothetical protein